ncbi:unnamed protein product [Heterobilharzia americana]|nr:unnamed protein product [Heterobilharzia americana]
MDVLTDSTTLQFLSTLQGYENKTKTCGSVNDTADEDDQLSLCCVCGQTFPSIKSLHTHINVVHEVNGENDDSPSVTLGSRVSLSSSSEEFIPRSETSVVCANCKNTFPDMTSLRAHINTVHHGNRTAQCDVCMKIFSTPSYLRMHIATVHEGVRAYSCDLCEKSYTQKHSLKKHLKSSHSSVFNQTTLDDLTLRNGAQSKCTPSSRPIETHTFKSRKKLLVDSPIMRDSSSPSPTGSNDVESSVSSETITH